MEREFESLICVGEKMNSFINNLPQELSQFSLQELNEILELVIEEKNRRENKFKKATSKKCGLFEKLDLQNIDSVFNTKEHLKTYLKTHFSGVRLVSLLNEINEEVFCKLNVIVSETAKIAFYNMFDTAVDFDSLSTVKIVRYINELEQEYENLKYNWDEIFEYQINNDEITILKYISNDENVIIPERIKGYTVTNIVNECFEKNSTIRSVDIQAKIKNIPNSCFFACYNLKTIKFPDSLKEINTGAFLGCERIVEIILPEELTHIDGMAFYECTNLEIVKLPFNLKEIGSGAFNKCKKIKELNISRNVDYIGHDATMQTFSKCTTILCEHDTIAEEYAIKHGYQIEYTN